MFALFHDCLSVNIRDAGGIKRKRTSLPRKNINEPFSSHTVTAVTAHSTGIMESGVYKRARIFYTVTLMIFALNQVCHFMMNVF